MEKQKTKNECMSRGALEAGQTEGKYGKEANYRPYRDPRGHQGPSCEEGHEVKAAVNSKMEPWPNKKQGQNTEMRRQIN